MTGNHARGLQAVLAAHEISVEHRAWPAYECSCEEWDGSEGTHDGAENVVDNDNAESARAHVAAAVLAWLDARLTDGDLIEKAADCGGVGYLCSHTGPVINDGCDDCRALATAALSAIRAALTEGAL